MEHVRRQGRWMYRRHNRRRKNSYQELTVQKKLLLLKTVNLQVCCNLMSGRQEVLNLLIFAVSYIFWYLKF